MSNKHIAINWATKMVKDSKKLVFSDQFFQPFTNVKTREKIVKELDARGVIVWANPANDNAFLMRKGDARLTVHSDGKIRVAIWADGNNLTVLPTQYIA